MVIYVGSDTVIRWDEMKDVDTEEPVNSAKVTMTLYDDNGDTVTGASGRTLYHVSDYEDEDETKTWPGRYHGTIPYNADLTAGGTYYLEIVATYGGSRVKRRIQCEAQYAGE